MFLKSLTLKGFKSFADSTTLDFEPGVTVVVGPNGSGKSNIVDAVAWVLGAQGPRALRSARMDDVIFAGTPGRPALGRAEVSLTIDNTAGQLPIDFSEVTITRTLFRSGDSEYAINRVPCRLLDVTDLLSDTGVGRQQHVIVSQGNLDSVLNARPEDRRLIVEEAAGILKFRRRRERAERRLESTEASVTRLGDLQREVRRQLRPLQRQAEAARRHGDLAAELTALRRFLAGRDLAGIEARLDVARARRAEMVAADDQICHRLRRADAAIAGAEAEISTLAQRNDQLDLAEALSRAEGLRARGRGLAALVAERRRSVERAQAASVDSSVVASLEAEAAELALQLDATEAEAAQLAADAREVTTAEEGLAEDACPAGVQAPGGASGGLAGALAPDPGDLERVRAEHAASGPVVGRAEAEWQRLGLRSTVLAGRGAGIDERIGRLSQVRSECEEAAGPLHLAEGAARSVLAGREAEMRSAESSRRAAAVEHDTCSARAEGLAQALDEARARAGAQRLASTEGYVGTLPELVDVHPGLEAAFEAAAREAVAAVVVDGVDGARRALGELDRLGAGGAVVPLPPPATGAGPSTLGPGLPAGARPLRPLVRTSLPAVAGLLDTLLGPAVVVDGDWSEAAELASRRPELTVVTPAGDRLAGGVWRTGAPGAGTTGAALEEAVARAHAAAAAAEEAEVTVGAVGAGLDAARKAWEEARRAVDANRSRHQSTSEEARRAETALADVQSEAALADEASHEARERLDSEHRRRRQLEAMLPDLEAAAAAEAAQAAADRAARDRLAQKAAVVAGRRRHLDVRAGALEQRRALLGGRLAHVEGRLQADVAQRAAAAGRRADLERQRVALDRLGAVVEDRGEQLDGLVEACRAARRRQVEDGRALAERVDGLRTERAGAERELAELRERAGRVDLDEAEARVRLEALTTSVRRELDCEPAALGQATCPPLTPPASPDSRVRELERELRLLGPVNPLAVEEHRALEERHTFLEAQLDDVRAARRELGKVIRAIDTEIVDVFRAAWADVSENFENLFAALFPGGRGTLQLTDPDHLLDTGIEIDPRPSGKNVRRLSLLSGGERSLTALAFLFAVFRSRPSPFYLMDEVEAALDDVNLHRFLDLLRQFRAEAQLLVVSHQKRTMEAADCLYGVTMAPGGSSRVVSERVSAPSP